MRTIGITGGTGFIGQHLTKLLVDKGYRVVVFTRSASRRQDGKVSYAHWDPGKNECDTDALKDLDAVVHLAGAGVADKRLTAKRKEEIIGSRVRGTEFLLGQLRLYAPRCKSLVAASAIGFYGAGKPGAPPFTESAPPAADFLGNTCFQWEEALRKGNELMRTVVIRIGIVLGKGGGAYPQLSGPLSFGVRPILGSGSQVVSWIAIDDLARMFLYMLENIGLSGTYNGVAPEPVTHRQLMRAIARVKGGPAIPVPVPAFVLRLVLGEMSEEVLKSCNVSAKKTLAAGFHFLYNDVAAAIKAIEGK